MNKLDPIKMLADAEVATGLSDWGDKTFRTPFELLVYAINEEGNLNAWGYDRAEKRLSQRLRSRLQLIEDHKLYPEIAEQKIERPVMVVGFPRAGTTYTHSLLGADPRNLSPLGWQFFVPSPPPNDPRFDHALAISEAQAIDEQQGWTKPNIRALHDFNPLHPEECARAFEMSFHSMSYSGYWNIPSYFEALTRDATAAYSLHKMTLQALQLGTEGRRWVLKAPEHTTQLEALFKVYPDAMLVQNHRDPARVMGSLVSIISGLRDISTDQKTKLTREFVLMQMQAFANAQQQLIAIRQDLEVDRRFIDINYLDLERNPIGSMKNIYARADMPFDDNAQKGISRWIESNRKGKHGKHQYSLEGVTVSREEIHEMYQKYIEYFNIELEPDAS